MADTTTLTDDELEQQKKLQQQATIGAPIASAPNGQAPIRSTTPVNTPTPAPIESLITGVPQTPASGGSTAPPMQAPDVGTAPSSTPPPTIGSPIQPPAPRPAGQALESLAAQGPPQLHGAKRFLDSLAGSTTIGSAIERASGMGTQGYKAKLDEDQAAANAEEGQITAGAKERSDTADTELKSAQAGEEKAKGAAETAAAGNVIITDPVTGHTLQVPSKDAASIYKSIIAQTGAGNRETQKETAAQALQSNKPISTDQLLAQAVQEGDQATVEKIKQLKEQIASAVAHASPGTPVPVTDGAGNIVGYAFPKVAAGGADWVPAGALGGGAAVQASGGQGGAIPPKPGAVDERMIKMADYSTSLIDKAVDAVNVARSELGPGAGRWNEFMQGKVGLKNIDFATVDSWLTFVDGAITLAHSQGRVSNLIYESFEKLYDAGKQDPDNLLAALKVGRDAMGLVGSVMKGQQPNTGGNTPPLTGGGSNVRVQQNSKGEYRHSTDGGKTWQAGKP